MTGREYERSEINIYVYRAFIEERTFDTDVPFATFTPSQGARRMVENVNIDVFERQTFFVSCSVDDRIFNARFKFK